MNELVLTVKAATLGAKQVLTPQEMLRKLHVSLRKPQFDAKVAHDEKPGQGAACVYQQKKINQHEENAPNQKLIMLKRKSVR